MPRPIHFELNVDDPERARKFYEGVFGWTFNRWEGPKEYWLVTTGPDQEPGINGGLMKREPGMPGAINTLGVESLDAVAKKVQERGGKVVVPKMAVPGVGWLAYCVDPEGNTFGLMQADETAR